MVGVRGVDEDVVERNPGLFGYPPRGVVEDIAREGHDITGDEARAAAVRTLDHHGRGTELALLPLQVDAPDAPTHNHIVGGLQQPCRGSRFELARGSRCR
jgi:hypothetical protein